MTSWLAWWALLLPIGVVGWPFAAILLPRFHAGAYAFAKALGLLLLGTIYWLGVTAHVLPNSRVGVLLALLVLGAAAGALALSTFHDRPKRRDVMFVAAIEALFFASFALAAFLRSYVPEIRDTEKPMELAFLNAVLRADHFPPEDPWLADDPISYYYFGYILLATVTQLAGTSVAIAFNLGLALTAALSVVTIFGFVWELVAYAMRSGLSAPRVLPWRPAAFALGGAALVLLIGNLEGVLEFGAAHGLGPDGLYTWWDIDGLDPPKSTATWYPDEFWWWWRATRVIPATITEFPFFSFMLGDLHPHVMAVPFRVVAFAVAAAVMLGRGPVPRLSAWRFPMAWPRLAIVAVVIGSMGFLQTWDLPVIAALLLAGAVFAGLRQGAPPLSAVGHAVGWLAPPLALGVVLFLPFWFSIDNPGWGPELVVDARTRPDHALLLWAPLGVLVALFAAAALAHGDRETLRDRGRLVAAALPAVAPPLLWLVLILGDRGLSGLGTQVSDRGIGWLTDIALAAALVALGLGVLQRARPGQSDRREHVAAVGLLLAFAGTLLVYGVEFFYIDDILHNRLNSVFKLYFQAWLMIGVSAALGLYYVLSVTSESRSGAATPWMWRAAQEVGGGLVALVLAGGLVYPVTATFARTDGFEGPRTLDGLAWLRETEPDEYRAQAWLRDHSEQDEIVLEAQGDAYTEAGRVSSRTGTPTLVGWVIHQVNWRGESPTYTERAAVANEIYASDDTSRVQRLLQQYGVDWVYVGRLERQTYPQADLDKFGQFMDVAFEDEGVTIYRMRNSTAPVARSPDQVE